MRLEAITSDHAAALDAVLEALPAMALLLGHDGAIEAASRRAAAALGHRPEELTGRPVAALLHRARDVGRLGAVLAGDPASLPLRCADGAALPLRLEAGRCADGRTVLTLGPMAATDAADPEAEARTSERALLRATDAIVGYAQLLQLAELDPWHRRHVEAILSAGETLAALLADRSWGGSRGRGSVALDLQALLADVVGRGRGAAREKGLRLSLSSSPLVPRHVATDGGGLERVLDALIRDAVGATREGGVTLRADALEEGAGSVRLRFQVCDTRYGTARPPERTASAQPRGRGPGPSLAACDEIAASLGGGLAVSPCPGGLCHTLEIRTTSP